MFKKFLKECVEFDATPRPLKFNEDYLFFLSSAPAREECDQTALPRRGRSSKYASIGFETPRSFTTNVGTKSLLLRFWHDVLKASTTLRYASEPTFVTNKNDQKSSSWDIAAWVGATPNRVMPTDTPTLWWHVPISKHAVRSRAAVPPATLLRWEQEQQKQDSEKQDCNCRAGSGKNNKRAQARTTREQERRNEEKWENNMGAGTLP